MIDSLSPASLPFSHSIPSRKFPYLHSLHLLPSSSHFSSFPSFSFITSPRTTFFLAFPRGKTHYVFSFEHEFHERFHHSNAAHMPDPSPQSFGRSAGPKPDSGRLVGPRRPQLARRFEYERFKEMFADGDLEMTEEPANAVRISSLDGGRSRMAQLSESQPSRLHNRFVVFERTTESKMVRLSSKGDRREDDHAKSGSVPRKLPRQKSSYNGQRKSNAKNLGRFSLNVEQEHTGDVASKSTSSNFSSKLQIILNNFSKRDLATAAEPTDNATGSFGLQVKKNSIVGQHENFRNPSIESPRDVRKDSHASEETDSTFFEFSVQDANQKLPDTSAQTDNEARTSSSFNLFSNAPPVPSVTSKYSSGSKFLSPIGEGSMGASRQHAHVSPRRLSRSIGSRSSPSRSSIPAKFSKYSKRTDLDHERGSALNTSTAETRPSSREEQPRFFFNSKEGLKSHASQELDGDTKIQHSSVDSFTGNSPSSSSSLLCFPESSTEQVPPQYHANFCPKVCVASDFEDKVQVGASAPPVVDGANHVSPLPQQFIPRSDVEDDMVDSPLMSGAVVEANAMSSSPERVVSLSKECNSSTMLADPNLDAHVRSLSDDEMSGLHIADDVTTQGALYSPAVLSAQSNLNSSSITDSDVESDQLQKVSLSANSATSQISSKNHPSSDLPFEFQYSYTETPNAPILRYRESQHSPFGPTTMDRPWTGRPPPKPSKKKPRLFDSFKPPPQGKKGIKYVQDPGPFPEGQSPKAAQTREEILGEPLTKEEVVYLVEKCKNEKRQVNLGRDGLTHNMLDLIHSQWKRRRVCKIKCKGVPTVDMDNVYFHIEDKTGGKIIHGNGGAILLFRGRNYNYRDRPRIPLMLWKPAAPVYPKLIQQAPGGLTKEQARKLRLLGRKTASMCRLGKNGVYLNLVKDVKNSFKVDDLVRIDCRGLNPSDYKKIGAKLRDLVPCVLISFEKEHILLWKGRGWGPKSVGINSENADTSTINNLESEAPNQSNSSDSGPLDSNISDIETNISYSEPSMSLDAAENSVLSCSTKQEISPPSCLDNARYAPGSSYSTAEDKSVVVNVYDPKSPFQVKNGSSENSLEEVKGLSEKDISSQMNFLEKQCLNKVDIASKEAVSSEYSLWTRDESRELIAELAGDEVDQCNSFVVVKVEQECSQINIHSIEVTALWQHALESGMASEIDADLDTDSVFHKADELAKTAPPGPTYTVALLKQLRLKKEKRVSDGISSISIGRMHTRQKKKEVKQVAEFPLLEAPPMGGLPIDELARLLAPK